METKPAFCIGGLFSKATDRMLIEAGVALVVALGALWTFREEREDCNEKWINFSKYGKREVMWI